MENNTKKGSERILSILINRQASVKFHIQIQLLWTKARK